MLKAARIYVRVVEAINYRIGRVMMYGLFVMMAILGMGFLAQSLGAFFSVIKYAGGAYLIWRARR